MYFLYPDSLHHDIHHLLQDLQGTQEHLKQRQAAGQIGPILKDYAQ